MSGTQVTVKAKKPNTRRQGKSMPSLAEPSQSTQNQKLQASAKSKPKQANRRNTKGQTETEDDEEFFCSGCKGSVDQDVKALQCEFCAVWSCLACSGVPESVYDMDVDDKIPGFVWTCNSCIHAIPTIKNLTKVLSGVKDEQTSCRSDINILNTKVVKLESSIDYKVQQAVEEYRDRENRKYNIITRCQSQHNQKQMIELKKMKEILNSFYPRKESKL